MDVPPAIAMIAVVSLAAFLSPVAAHRNGSSLSSERVQVYADLIDSFTRTGLKLLSSKTFPLNLSVVANDAVCLQGVHLESTDESAEATHLLGAEVLRGRSIRIISKEDESAALKQQQNKDGATSRTNSSGNGSTKPTDPGILALSEIIFDTTHQFAVIKYVFPCGPHCNSGAIVVLEKCGTGGQQRGGLVMGASLSTLQTHDS
jgi:hypothetical protein